MGSTFIGMLQQILMGHNAVPPPVLKAINDENENDDENLDDHHSSDGCEEWCIEWSKEHGEK